MAEIRFEVGDPKTKRTYGKAIENYMLTGKKIGEKIDGQLIGLNGYELEISGGSDSAGFPMRPDIDGLGRKRLIFEKTGVGFKEKKRKKAHKQNHYFVMKRKAVRGNTISQFTQQINLKVIKSGDKNIGELWGIADKAKEEPKKESVEKKIEASKATEIPKAEVKKE